MNAFPSRSGGCCCGSLTLNKVGGSGSESSCSRVGAVLDDEQKVAGKKRTYRTAVVAVVI
jgi:hypothetical protein